MSIIYEVTLEVDAGIAGEYDAWLESHVEEMLRLPGFLGAEILVVERQNPAPDYIGRVVHYRLENQAALDAYFRDNAERMREQGQRRFGRQARASRRILRSVIDPS